MTIDEIALDTIALTARDKINRGCSGGDVINYVIGACPLDIDRVISTMNFAFRDLVPETRQANWLLHGPRIEELHAAIKSHEVTSGFIGS